MKEKKGRGQKKKEKEKKGKSMHNITRYRGMRILLDYFGEMIELKKRAAR